MWPCFVLLLVGSMVCDHVGSVVSDNVVVDTPAGPIKGRDEGNYTTFFGIPYARVERSNPFGASTKLPNFATPFEAFDSSIKCPQPAAGGKVEGELNCLRLNIYVPPRGGKKLPVFLWFHGGGFFFGSSGHYDGRYLIQHDIIVVTANYRLGPYGFLCLDHPEVPGNQGLKDQTTALKWVKDNVAAFGGDPGKITIAGESYGGGSVDLHMYSNYEKYFDKAVIQSGGARVEAMFVKPDYKAAIKLASLLNHKATDNDDAIKFLATVDPLELTKVFNSSKILLRACKEKKFDNVQSFITEDPFHLTKPTKIKGTPVLFGYNSKENFGEYANKPDEFFAKKKDVFFDKLNNTFNLEEDKLRKLADIVKKFYLGSKPVNKENFLALVDFSADYMLNFAAENSVDRLVEQGAHVYKYIFSYTGNSPYKNVKGVGAYHTEELQYLFLFLGKELTDPEHTMMRDRMTTLWANFVKYGNPTPETSSLIPVVWSEVPQGSRPYMNIDLDLAMMQDVYHHRIAFWDLLLQEYWRHSRIISSSHE